MPRDPNNNPTERICNLLLELEALEWAHSNLFALASEVIEASVLTPFVRPNLEAFAAEKVRQGRNYRGPRPEILRQRAAQERLRARGGSVRQLTNPSRDEPPGRDEPPSVERRAIQSPLDPILTLDELTWDEGKRKAQEIINNARRKDEPPLGK